MVNNAALRPKVKKCINALDPHKPIVFGQKQLMNVSDSLDDNLYVPHLHGDKKDLLQELADQIDFDEGGGTYLFSGNRGTGKTTELMRLAKVLTGLNCEVFYINIADYLNLTVSVEVSDCLLSLLGAFSEKIEERYQVAPAGSGFFERIGKFLQSNVVLQEFTLPAPGLPLKLALKENPDFKKKLQTGMRGYVAQLVAEARQFVGEALCVLQQQCPDKKVVLLVDSLEQLRGIGDSKDVAEVFKSAETLFSGHADKLRFQSLYLVCAVPPYLSALAGNLATLYSGGKIYMLPSIHIYQGKPLAGQRPVPSEHGMEVMLKIVEVRFPEWQEFFTRQQMLRLSSSSGGDLRDFFRLIKLCISQALYQDFHLPEKPLAEEVFSSAESDVRNDMPLAHDDREWLRKVQHSHSRELDNLDRLPAFARLTENKYILNYRNGDDWFDVHPLLRDQVGRV